LIGEGTSKLHGEIYYQQNNQSFVYKNLGDDDKTAYTFERIKNKKELIENERIIHFGDDVFFKIILH